MDSSESVSKGLASRLKETGQGKADAGRSDTVAKDAHTELEVERARLEDESAQLLLRERETERAQEALFKIRHQESGTSSSHSVRWQRRKLLRAAHVTWRLKEDVWRVRASIVALGSILGGDEFLE